MNDQLTIGTKSSYDDFEASVKERKKKASKKKVIKDSVPFSNVTYDFSAINGELYWEERELEYVFEILADSAEELERKKIPFKSWLMNIQNEKLFDPFIEGYHFVGTFSDISEDDSEFEKATITVTFTAYPYMIANNPKEYHFTLAAGVKQTVEIQNDSSHRITPKIVSDVTFKLGTGDISFSVPAGEVDDDSFKLKAGRNVLTLESTTDGSVMFSFVEEVF